MKRLFIIAISSLMLWSCSEEGQSPSLVGHWIDVSNEKNTVTFNEDRSYELNIAVEVFDRMNAWLPAETPSPGRETITILYGNYDLKEHQLWLKSPFGDNTLPSGIFPGSFYGYSIEGIWNMYEDENGSITVAPGKLKSDITWNIQSLTTDTLIVKTGSGATVTYKRSR